MTFCIVHSMGVVKMLVGVWYGDIMAVKSLLPHPLIFIYHQYYITIGDIMVKVEPILKQCKQCKQNFETSLSKINAGRGKFCSQECYSAWRKDNNARVMRTCKHCKQEFETFQSEVKRGSGKFCSRECYYAWKVGENNPNWCSEKLEFLCLTCGKRFYLTRCDLKNQRGLFCSRECLLDYKSKNKMPDAQRRISRNMHRNVKRYLKDGKLGRKWSALVGYSLEDLCKHLEKDFREGMVWANYGKWHIDHIIPLSKFRFESFEDEGFKKAWSLNNLQPLWADENLKKGRRWRWY